MYPISINKDYGEGEIYNFQIRCVGEELKNHFLKFLTNEYTTHIKALTCERVDNRTPIATNFKGRRMLGDKITLTVDTGIEAQNIAYMLLGTGIGDMSPRGYGYMNYQYIK